MLWKGPIKNVVNGNRRKIVYEVMRTLVSDENNYSNSFDYLCLLENSYFLNAISDSPVLVSGYVAPIVTLTNVLIVSCPNSSGTPERETSRHVLTTSGCCSVPKATKCVSF